MQESLSWLTNAWAYFRQTFLFIPCVIALLIGMNALSIVIDFLGTYFWFFSSFDRFRRRVLLILTYSKPEAKKGKGTA